MVYYKIFRRSHKFYCFFISLCWSHKKFRLSRIENFFTYITKILSIYCLKWSFRRSEFISNVKVNFWADDTFWWRSLSKNFIGIPIFVGYSSHSMNLFVIKFIYWLSDIIFKIINNFFHILFNLDRFQGWIKSRIRFLVRTAFFG